MKRRFNITGSCNPQRHYMVRLDDRLKRIKEEYVDEGSYFVINRGRQYGKTTTLQALRKYLAEEYIIFSLDFQLMGTEDFLNEAVFTRSFLNMLSAALQRMEVEDKEELMEQMSRLISYDLDISLRELFAGLSSMCEISRRPIVLMIDEVDSASNNQVFIDFLAQLRGCYLNREETPIFHSVILAGVYNIKNLKLKLRPESEHQYNSPWNTREDNEENVCLHTFDECSRDHRELAPYDIAADFDVEMSFQADQIASMLEEYEADYHTGMDISAVAGEIYAYTSGYPVLVSSICKRIDEKIFGKGELNRCLSSGNTSKERSVCEFAGNPQKAWSKEGVEKAVSIILKENPPLFESMAKQLDTYPDLHSIIEDIIYRGKRIPYSPEEKSISLGVMFGFLKEENSHVAIANRIFEMCLLNMFMAREAITSDVFSRGGSDRIGFIRNNMLDMELVLKKFVEYFNDIYGEKDIEFTEKYGRKFFLLYLKPIINGAGNYYLEAQTRDEKRTDVIVDYSGEQFIIEMKIWHGNEYNERGEALLLDYLEYYHRDKGYMLSFNFNKKKETGVKEIRVGGKTIIEAVV